MSDFLSVPVVWVLVFLHSSHAVFSPNIKIQSCASHSVVVRLENAGDGGLIYIQGSGLECSRTTVSETSYYTFDFDTCGLQYDQEFRVVVQQRPHLQTGDDKVIPAMCFVDTSELVVTGVIYPEDTLGESVNKTVRPTVRMAIQAEGNDETLWEVTLDDNIKMVVSLEDQYLSDFDIKAKDCTAAFIPVVTDECSSDEELFPNFEKSEQGILTTNFQAFQPTNLDVVQDVDVFFACNVAVCKGQCEKTVCGEIVGWGRKKRNDDNDDVIDRVITGTKVRVKSPHAEEAQAVTATSEYCAQKVVVTTVTSITAVTLIFSWALCGCVLSKLIRLEKKQPMPKKANPLRRLSEINANIARSVGRRLSTMLNLPFGYDMRDSKMMDQIPEMYPTPPTKRRESVTVSTASTNEHTDTDDVSIGSSTCVCVLRKRLVTSGSQTDSEFEHGENRTTLNKKPPVRSTSPMSHIRSNNPITSLSIKSITRSNSDGACALNSENLEPPTDLLKPRADGITESRVYYTADELPINREIGLKRQANISSDSLSDTTRNFNMVSNVTVINVEKPEAEIVKFFSPSNKIELEMGKAAQVDDIYENIECMSDEFDVSSGSVGGSRTSSGVNDHSLQSDRRGATTSVFNSFLSSSKKTLGRVADVLTSLPNKDKFDLNAGSFPTEGSAAPFVLSVRREPGEKRMSISEKSRKDRNNPSKNEANENERDTDENFYEPIYFGEQLKPERKLSTHV